MKRITSLTILGLSAILVFHISINGQSGPNAVDWETKNTNSAVSNLQNSSFDSLVAWQEQIVLHLDKSLLTPKDHLFFKAYVLTGPNRFRVSASDVLKVELLDEEGTLINSQYHKIVKGSCQGSIEIPKKTKDGTYYFRAYTRWMLNYGPDQIATKKIRISGKNGLKELNVNPSDQLTVFPEGGTIVAGLSHNVAVSFKNNDYDKLPVFNSTGEEVASVTNYGMGLGTFLFRPLRGERYSIRLDEHRYIDLPEVQDNGYSMQLSNLDEDNLRVRIEASSDLRRESIYLKGKSKGVLYVNKAVDFEKKDIIVITIPKADLPNGLINFSLEDEYDQVWAYRSIYIDKEELQIQVERQTEFSGNEIISVRVTDREGLPIQTELSLGLIGQELTENRSDPLVHGKYVEHTIRNRRFLNDLLVLTGQFPEHLPGNLMEDIPGEIRYAFQDGLEFYGQAYDLNNSLLINTKIQILISTPDDVIARETVTNSDGLFKLYGLQIYGEAHMVFRTIGEDINSKLVKVIPYEYEIPPLRAGDLRDPLAKQKPDHILPKIAINDFHTNSEKDRLITLDEITLSATKPFRNTTPSIYNIEATRVIYQDVKRPKTLPQLFLGIPGLQVVGLGSLTPALVLNRSAGSGPFVWVVDGFPMMPSTSLVDIINLLSYADIERMELLIGADASMYGSRSAGGVIRVYTRSGSESENIERKTAQMKYQGFHESIRFENYRETVLNKGKRRSEMPTTLYWNPYLTTDENGEAIINISISDSYDRIELRAYTITENGASGNLKTNF